MKDLVQGVRSEWRMSLVLIALTALLTHGCAKTGMPGGGPPDTTPPEIVRTQPAAGAVGVPRVASITIEFSELVDQATLTPGLTVSPPLAGTPEAKWSGRVATIRWNDSLRSDITYRFAFGEKLSDRQKNRLKEPVTIAFSTGLRIDSCLIKGVVKTTEAASGGLNVLAYQLDSSKTWPPATADFITQAGPTGQFNLPFLPHGLYRLIVVGDKNRNGRPDQNELFAVSTADIDLRTVNVAEGVRFYTSAYDTTAFKIGGCSQSTDGSLLIGLTHAADTIGWRGAKFVVTDSASKESLTISVLRPVPPKFVIIPVISEQFTAGRTYDVTAVAAKEGEIGLLRDAVGHAFISDSCRVAWAEVVDTVGPRVNWTSLPTTENATSGASPIQIGFNEPVDTLASSGVLRVRDTLGTDLPGMTRWLDPRHVVFTPANPWPESLIVVTSLDSTRLFDRHGHLAPSQTIAWKFRPLLKSQLGALAGRIEVTDSGWATIPCHLEARPVGKGAIFNQAFDRPGTFEITLPAGRWVLGAYLDLNRDGRWNGGQFAPFHPPEPRIVQPDTVTVRARFTIEGVVVRF